MLQTLAFRLLLAALPLLWFGMPAQAATFYGPTPYLDASDSPFFGLGLALEDFENGLLDTPGVTASGGAILAPDPLTDSVDPDGYSWYSGDPGVAKITFTFSGPLPTRAGVVWTDIGRLIGETTPFTGADDVLFEAFDENGNSLGQIGPVLVGDGVVIASQAEDRFFGVHHAGGISRIEIGMSNSEDWELDHLQFGVPVPEPGSAALLLLGLTGLAIHRGRRLG